MATPSAASFTLLPRELRDMVYEIILSRATLSLPKHPLYSTSDPAIKPRFNICISSNQTGHRVGAKITHSHLHLPSNLIYTNHQINQELSSIIYSRIDKLQLTGDFLTGLEPTKPIFDILARKPWITQHAKTVTISLRLGHVLPVNGGVAVNSKVLSENPWLGPHLSRAGIEVRGFSLGDSGVVFSSSALDINPLLAKLRSWIRNFATPVAQFVGIDVGRPHDTLPELVGLLQTFPGLEKVEIGSQYRHVLTLFLSSPSTWSPFPSFLMTSIDATLLIKPSEVLYFWGLLSCSHILFDPQGFWTALADQVRMNIQTIPEVAQRKNMRFALKELDGKWGWERREPKQKVRVVEEVRMVLGPIGWEEARVETEIWEICE